MRIVSMTRRIKFSSGHRYWRPELTPQENRHLFGPMASPHNHGHNYVLDVVAKGEVDARTGMLVNIKRVDDALKDRVKHAYDQRSINDEVESMIGKSPSLEMILADLWHRLVDSNGYMIVNEDLTATAEVPVAIECLRLEEMPTLYAESHFGSPEVQLTRTYEFAAAHRLNAPDLSMDRNLALYGKCNHVNGHGHNYVLEVTVSGVPDHESGFICNIEELDAVVDGEILRRYDHRNLDLDVDELAGVITTSENVAIAIFDRLHGKTPAPLARVRLWETARNMFEVNG
jgi:6-pyruvoyltetrahydropterin/6-carboxytetrahydropterin synthase